MGCDLHWPCLPGCLGFPARNANSMAVVGSSRAWIVVPDQRLCFHVREILWYVATCAPLWAENPRLGMNRVDKRASEGRGQSVSTPEVATMLSALETCAVGLSTNHQTSSTPIGSCAAHSCLRSPGTHGTYFAASLAHWLLRVAARGRSFLPSALRAVLALRPELVP